ncbi:MAG: uroporphyrinogen methyltransferase / synthase [Actinomycetota bacterium]|nr:uroporphyrinogen methyltransferase / synthase [Actinomycetota bacterium]
MTVYLVGGGPGDPGLITVRGAEVLARADVVVYDRLSVTSLLDLAPARAERISVGKAPGRASRPQAEINALLVERGRAGQEVVRLKGGDPFVFARGGEEVAALRVAGVPFEIVPGITSAVAVPAYAGVPVTHRGLASSFTIVTGQEGEAGLPVDWEAVARLGGTIAVLMGVAKREEIARRLMAGGLPADTPVAAVTWGTRPEQRTVRTTLGRLGGEPIESPAVMLVGAVATLDLPWYEARPLFGRRVIVTRAREQASGLVERLQELGAATVELPVIEIGEPDDGGAALREAAARVGKYDWVVFTSANAVVRFFAALGAVGSDTRALGGRRVAAIGPGTADALAGAGVRADLVPERFVAESLLEAFPPGPGRVLLPRAAVARDALPAGLAERGFTVDVVEAYRTIVGRPSSEALGAAATASAVTFTSSSTVTNYLAVAGDLPVPPVVACIGPITADTARAAGLSVDVVAAEHTIDGLVTALVGTLGRGGSTPA